MYGRVTKVMTWILPLIQKGECGQHKAAHLRKVKKNIRSNNQRRYGY